MDKLLEKVMRATKYKKMDQFKKNNEGDVKNKHKKHSSKNIFYLLKKLFFYCFFYLPKITGLFWKSATLQCANVLPKSNARAHLKQRKNIVALHAGRPVVTRQTTL